MTALNAVGMAGRLVGTKFVCPGNHTPDSLTWDMWHDSGVSHKERRWLIETSIILCVPFPQWRLCVVFFDYLRYKSFTFSSWLYIHWNQICLARIFTVTLFNIDSKHLVSLFFICQRSAKTFWQVCHYHSCLFVVICDEVYFCPWSFYVDRKLAAFIVILC